MQPILQAFLRKITVFSVFCLVGQTPQYANAQACTTIYRVWTDCDADGQQGTFENGLANVTVTLYNANCVQLQQVTTNNQGYYTLANFAANTMYYIVFGNGQFANGVLNVNGKSHNLSPANVGTELTDSDAQIGSSAVPSCASGKPYIQFTTNASGCANGLLDAGFAKLDFQVDNIALTHETCGGDRNGRIAISLSNVEGGYSTTITGSTPMANVTSYSNLAAGTYDVEIRSNSPVCNTFYKTTVTINAGPTIAPPTVTDDMVCRYEVTPMNGGLKANCPPCPTGGTPTVTWWTAQTGGIKVYTGATFDPVAQNWVNTSLAGTATFWAQCECNGCSSPRVRGNFVIKPRPNPIITGEEFPCPGSTQTYTTLSVAGNTYTWSLPDGGGTIVARNNNSITVAWTSPAGTGAYRVRVVESSPANCSEQKELSVWMLNTQLSCVESVNATVSDNCKFELSGSTLFGSRYNGAHRYTYQLKTIEGFILEQGVGSAIVDGTSITGNSYLYIGKQLIYAVTEPCSGNTCWGTINFEDKTAPTITCPVDITISCSQTVEGQTPPLVVTGSPTVVDCSKTNTNYTDVVRETSCLQPFTGLPNDLAAIKTAVFPTTGDVIKIILRTFIVRDVYDNSTTCSQYIFVRKNRIDNVICPTDFELDCRNYTDATSIDPSVTGMPIMDIDGDLNTTYDRTVAGLGTCKMDVSYSDQKFALCSNSFKIIRTWTIFDPCAVNNPQTIPDERIKVCSQTILVSDKTAPSVTAAFTQYYIDNNSTLTRDTTVTFDGYIDLNNNSSAGTIQDVWALGYNTTCGGKTQLTFRMKDEGCTRTQVNIRSNDSRARMANGYPRFDSNTGETIAVFDINYLDLGDYDVTFTVSDECGFMSAKKTFRIKIRDNVRPNVVCKTYTQVSLTNTGAVRAYFQSFNNVSTDNCGIEKIEVRRMSNCQNPADTVFKPYVDFNCCDVNTSVQVVLRVWDAHGNYNECMVIAYVDDKIKPTCTIVPNKTISCTDYIFRSTLDFGKPQFWDNCGIVDTVYTEIEQVDNCKVGTLLRKWVITDGGGLKDSCQQLITIRSKSDFTVDFPDDVVVNCFASVLTREQAKTALLSNSPDKDGHIVNNGCGVLAVEVEDDTLTATPDACYKILRKFTVIDWCKYNPNNYDKSTSCYGLPVCGDVHSNSNWATQNLPSWQHLNRPGCTNPYERRFRDADELGGTTAPFNPYAFSDGIICFTQVIKVVDNIAPQFIDCKDTLVRSFASLGCVDDVKITVTANDLCAAGRATNTDYLVYRWAIVDSATNQTLKVGYGNTVFEPFEYNRNYRIVWSVEDRCGNRTYCTQKVKVIDVKAPAILCKNINAELMRDAVHGGSVQAWATDFMVSSLQDNCTPSSYLVQKLVIEKDSASSGHYPSVGTTVLTFTCQEAGRAIPVRLWTIDQAGNENYCLARINVQDNLNFCNNAAISAVNGSIKTEGGENIAGVTVSASLNGETVSSGSTNALGIYTISNLIRGANYTIRANRDDLPLNGVTTFDLAMMSRHILGSTPLSTPYKIIAADINRDGEVNALDLLFARRMILRLVSSFPNNTSSWRFVDKRYNFEDATDPLAEDFPEVVIFNNMPLAAQAEFVGLKVGDVSGNAWVGSSSAEPATTTRGNRKALLFTADDIDMVAGKEYAITFSSDDFNVQAFQFTLNHTEGVEIVQIEKGQLTDLTENNFGRFKTALTMSWNGRFKGKLDNVFSLVLRAKQNIKLSEALTIGSNLTKAEAYDSAGDEMDIKLIISGLNTEGGNFALYQNEPNPFDNQTKIAFHLPTESQAKLTIYDAAGRVLNTIERKFAKGYNEIRLTKEDLQTTGILYYRLDTPTHSATKKMIIIP
ncbi:MAG: T9SS type A sorting domain-containing protein [Saprospiraceae bacterium]|nr:T9SS type A sorting domain-containing protein [Saprospiraceae bacterium]